MCGVLFLKKIKEDDAMKWNPLWLAGALVAFSGGAQAQALNPLQVRSLAARAPAAVARPCWVACRAWPASSQRHRGPATALEMAAVAEYLSGK